MNFSLAYLPSSVLQHLQAERPHGEEGLAPQRPAEPSGTALLLHGSAQVGSPPLRDISLAAGRMYAQSVSQGFLPLWVDTYLSQKGFSSSENYRFIPATNRFQDNGASHPCQAHIYLPHTFPYIHVASSSTHAQPCFGRSAPGRPQGGLAAAAGRPHGERQRRLRAHVRDGERRPGPEHGGRVPRGLSGLHLGGMKQAGIMGRHKSCGLERLGLFKMANNLNKYWLPTK